MAIKPKSRTKTKAAFEGEGLAGEVFEVGVGKLDASAADVSFGVSEISRRGSMHVLFKCLGVRLLEVFKLSRPGKRADNVYVYAVLAPPVAATRLSPLIPSFAAA